MTAGALPPAPPLQPDMALFLDLDGTLAPFEARPEDVAALGRRSRIVSRLVDRLGGALAILSGRTVSEIDRILDAACIPVAGVHGLTRRTSTGQPIALPPAPGLAHARQVLLPLAAARQGLLLEDKIHSLAVHYRLAPGAAAAVREICERLAAQDGLVVQNGEMVCELRSPGPTKGDSLKTFMAEAPFNGRRPVMVGDDLTDEHAFAAAQQGGGFGVLVGELRPTAARFHLRDVAAILDWLEDGAEALFHDR